MSDTPSDLDVLSPEPRVVVVQGESITLRPFYFGQWPKAIRLFRPVTEAVQRAGIAGFSGAGLSLASDWVMRLPAVMDEGGEPLLEFLAFAVGKPRAWFDTVGGDDGVTLAKAVFEVQADFFVRKLAPMMGLTVTPATTAPEGPKAPDGAALSPASSPADTPEPTSIA